MRLQRSLLLLALLASAGPTAVATALLVRERGGVHPGDALAIGGSLALALLLAGAVARSAARPIGELVRGVLDVARGRFGLQVQVSARNELGDLAYSFNHMSRELASYDQENQRLIAALERGYLDTIRSLAAAVDAKDPYTRGHAERVAALSVEIGRELGLPREQLQALEYGGILHDIGKIGIPDAILSKREPLTDEEMALVRGHSATGAEIVSEVEFLGDAVPAIRHHHERWDGGGYPSGLEAGEIPLVARIVNIADTWDACTSRRPYQAPMAPEAVVAILEGLRGAQTDPRVHDALVAVLRRRGHMGAQGVS